jgi:hypothetical protein
MNLTGTSPRLRELIATDRCDRCSARATVAYELESGSELMFCTHHASLLPKEVTSHWHMVGAGNF